MSAQGCVRRRRIAKKEAAFSSPLLKTGERIKPVYLVCPLAVLLVMLVVSSFTGHWPTDENPYRSYTLQAAAWLEGRLDLGQDYSWLELAVVDGKYYVSFPPFPSFVLLPFVCIFGVNTPDHLISLAFTLTGVVYALRLFEQITGGLEDAPLYVLFLFLGNGYLFISMQGWVWYLAQCMCFTLSLMALYYAARGSGGASLTCLACAIGCRPMVALYLPLLLALLSRRRKAERGGGGVRQGLCRRGFACLPAILIVSAYLGLNYARFGNPLEFGHNYLPEFVRAEGGQFSLAYAPEHLRQLIRLPGAGGKDGALRYGTYDCMAFWLIAPMSLSLFAAWASAVRQKRKTCGFELIALPAMLCAHLMIVCCHHTMGGYQFGNRYLVDMLPYVFYGLLTFKTGDRRLSQMNLPLFMLGFSVNLIGTVATYNHWL